MYSNKSKYIPPPEHGLSNSEQIIPNYYLKTVSFIENGVEKETKYLNIGYLNIIKDDIKNMRKLKEEQLLYIKNNLTIEEKDEIFLIMNECFNCLIDVVLSN